MAQPVTVPYVSLGEVKEYLQINSNTYDTRISNLISYACSVVESYVGREIKNNVYTELYNGGTSQVFVSRLPLNSVKSITEYDGSTHKTLIGPSSDGSFVSGDFDTSTITSTAILKTRRKKFGESSVYFNGSAFISANDPETGNPKFDFQSDDFTIEGWFRFEDLSNTKAMVSRGDANTKIELSYSPYLGVNFRALNSDTEVANVHHFTSTSSTSSYYVPKANSFSHYALSREDNNIRLFIDGSLIKTQSTSNSLPSISTSTPLYLGKTGVTGSENYFKGYIDEFRITIDAKYTNTFTAPTIPNATDENTVLLLHFNGTNNNSALKDDSRTTPEYIWDSETGGIKRYNAGVLGVTDISVIPETTFRNFPRGVKVTYDAGFTIIPRDIKVATLDYIKILHKQTQENAGFSLQGESGKSHGLSANFPPHIRRVLEMYRVVM